jgi:DNA polymerase III subunit epsilon
MLLRWLKRSWHRRRLKDPAYAFLFDPPPPGEAVSFDCETTGLDRRRDDIVSIAAVRIKDNRILTSKRFEAFIRPVAKMNPEAIKIHGLRERDVAMGRALAEVLPQFLQFIGSRPLVGYYLEFDCAMVDRYLRRWLGIELPNPRIEVSGLYYDRKYSDAPPGSHVDLTFSAMLDDLDLPRLDQHDAYADALMTAMIYLRLRDLAECGQRIRRSLYESRGAFTAG